jgi:hypothetical protein
MAMINEKTALFLQSLQLFTSVVMDSAGIDYHVSLAANAFQKCLDVPELQPELLCALVKQTTPHIVPLTKHNANQGSGGGVQVKRQSSIKHPRVSRFICFQVSHDNTSIKICIGQ